MDVNLTSAHGSIPPFPQPQKTSVLAVWSLILSLVVCLGPFSAIPAIICGHVALSRIKASGGKIGGRGMAMIGTILGYIVLVLSVAAVPVGIRIARELKKSPEFKKAINAAFEAHVIKSEDGSTQISVPMGWSKATKLNDKADLQASNLLRGEHLIVLSEAKADFVDFTLQKHDATTLKSLVEKLDDGQAGKTIETTVNGRAALQTEVSGTTANTRIVYLHTTVEDATQFHQILAWSLKSKFDQNKDDLQKAVASFKSGE